MDRVLSAYKFSTEVAARALHDPAPRHDPRATNTRNVWPWSGLVPWLEEELVLRSHRFKTQSERDTSHLLDPYNNSLILPLHEWIESPLVHKLVHNGQTMQVHSFCKAFSVHAYSSPHSCCVICLPLHGWCMHSCTGVQLCQSVRAMQVLQGDCRRLLPRADKHFGACSHALKHERTRLQVLGVTDYSQWEEAGSMRECLQSPAEEAQARRRQALALAIKRISHFAHVGVTEMLNESIASLAAILGLRMQGLAWQVPLSVLQPSQPECNGIF